MEAAEEEEEEAATTSIAAEEGRRAQSKGGFSCDGRIAAARARGGRGTSTWRGSHGTLERLLALVYTIDVDGGGQVSVNS